MKYSAVAASLLLSCAATCGTALSQQSEQQTVPLSAACQTPASASADTTPLPNLAKALQSRKTIKVLSIGASANVGRNPSGGGYNAIIEGLLENTIKGLDVQIIDRGVSGELARAVAERLKVEVALTQPDLVLWQMSPNDAMARVPVANFKITVTDMVRWLRSHDIDVIIVGIQYARSMVNDPHYQALRTAVREIAESERVIRVGRYEATEFLDRASRVSGRAPQDEVAMTEASYGCMAEFVARAISVAIFKKP